MSWFFIDPITSRSILLEMIFHLHHYYTKRVYVSVFNKRLITKHERRTETISQSIWEIFIPSHYEQIIHICGSPRRSILSTRPGEGNGFVEKVIIDIKTRIFGYRHARREYCGHSNIKSKFASTWFCRRTKLEKCPNFFLGCHLLWKSSFFALTSAFVSSSKLNCHET